MTFLTVSSGVEAYGVYRFNADGRVVSRNVDVIIDDPTHKKRAGNSTWYMPVRPLSKK